MHPHSAPGKTNPARVILPFIYCAGWVYVLKPVLKLNLADGINFPKNLFIRTVLGFRRKSVFKTKPRQRNNCLGGLFLRFGIMALPKNGLKLNIVKKSRLVIYFIFRVYVSAKIPALKLNLASEINFRVNLFTRRDIVFRETVLKPHIAKGVIFREIYFSSWMYVFGETGLKTKPRQRNIFGIYPPPGCV